MKALIIQKRCLLKLMLRDVKRRRQVFAISVVSKSIGMTANRNAAELEMRRMYLFENVALSQERHFSLSHFVNGS